MSRLSIEVSEHDHQTIKAMAALNGVSIKDYILKKTLPLNNDNSEAQALMQLEEFILPRIREAESGKLSQLTMKEILAKANSQYLA